MAAFPASSIPSSSFTHFPSSSTTSKLHNFLICNSATKSRPEPTTEDLNPSNSLSDQLKPLSLTFLQTQTQTQTHETRFQPDPKPKSTWVNPTKPKPTILTLTRHQRYSPSYNPDLKPLSLLSRKLSNSSNTDELTANLSEAFPEGITQETALLMLNSIRPWQNCYHFFMWLKAQNFFPLETIFYNVVMRSLKQDKQSELVEKLANEMIDENIQLDNVTYSTLITCLKRCRKFDSAISWFERMYKTGVMPDEVTYSSILDVYAKLGKRAEVISLYERARAGGWKPDAIAFSMLAKMFGEVGDYDGIQYVLNEIKNLGIRPNIVVYNSLLEAMGKAGKPGLARSLFEQMLEEGLSPNEKTLTALIKIYGKARWGKDALELWERMRVNNWPIDFILYNTLLSMCASLGFEEQAECLFADMKRRKGGVRPDKVSYTAMVQIYGSGGKVDKAMEVYEEMLSSGVQPNVMSCTCLIQCLAKAKRIKDAVSVFENAFARGVKPDDRLCGCLLSVVALCEDDEELKMALSCLEKGNPRLVELVKIIGEEETSFDQIKVLLRAILCEASVDVRRPFCNCLIDIVRNQSFPSRRANEILYLGNMFGLYPGLHSKSSDEWSLNLRSLSVGAANTAFEEWVKSLYSCVENGQELPEVFCVHTGSGTHRFSQGLPVAFAMHLKKLGAPFRRDELRSGSFIAQRDDLISWVQGRARVAEFVA